MKNPPPAVAATSVSPRVTETVIVRSNDANMNEGSDAATAPIPLFRRYPALATRLPWLRLTDVPTPVVRASRLESELGVKGLYVKRDDLSAPGYGGGKPRKLEFLFAEAKARGFNRVVSWGGVGSNQAVATAAHAPRVGLQATLLLLHQQSSAQVRANLLADVAFGAELRQVMSQDQAETTAAALSVRAGSDGAYSIPMGGSTPLGNMGFVNAAFELDEQIRSGLLPEPQRIYMAMGTMGSAVGLAIGLAACERRSTVVAVRVSNIGTSSPSAFAALFRSTVDYIREHDPTFPPLSFEQASVRIEGAQLGKGYARATAAGQRAVAAARRLAQLQLETTYTGKALAALIADAPDMTNEHVLFWNSHNSHALPSASVAQEVVPPGLRGYLHER